MNVPAKLEVRSFTCSWVNMGTQKLGRSLPMPIWEAVGGRGWYSSKERWWVYIGRP